MSIVTVSLGMPIFERDWMREPTEEEKEQWEFERTFRDLKAKHEQFLRDREAKERRLLYAIAEKLGIDVDKV